MFGEAPPAAGSAVRGSLARSVAPQTGPVGHKQGIRGAQARQRAPWFTDVVPPPPSPTDPPSSAPPPCAGPESVEIAVTKAS